MTSIEKLNVLISQMGENWKEYMDNFLKDEEDAIEEEWEDGIREFLNICKEEIMDNNISVQKQVEEVINNDLLYKKIQEYINKQLRTYYATCALRTMAATDIEKTKTLVKEIFNMTVLRFNPKIIQEYEKFGYTSEDNFIEFLNVLDAMTMYMVRRNLHVEAIKNSIYMNTRLPHSICEQMAKIIDKNFESLKMNYIIDTLNKLD